MYIVGVINATENELPMYSYARDSGGDLRAAQDTLIPCKGSAVVNTGIRIELPDIGPYPILEAQIRPRSGLAAKFGVFCNFGTVDGGYTGELKVIMFNLGEADYLVEAGDKIAQLVIAKVERVCFQPALVFLETERGDNGLGSTGNA